jgi:hypothetical protein
MKTILLVLGVSFGLLENLGEIWMLVFYNSRYPNSLGARYDPGPGVSCLFNTFLRLDSFIFIEPKFLFVDRRYCPPEYSLWL